MSPLDSVTPPSQNHGVGASAVWLPPGPWATVLEFLAHRFPHIGLARWQQRLTDGLVRDEHSRVLHVDAPYRANTKIFYFRHVEAESRIPFDEAVIHQDEHLVVADKPHFLPVTPGGRFVQETLLVRLKRKLGLADLSPLHRIDLETAGLVAFCIHPQERGLYQALFRERAVDKTYEALVRGQPDLPQHTERHSRIVESEHFMQMKEVPGEPNAHTRIELIEQSGDVARLRLRPTTGRKHQLRVHLAALGMPIIGDRIYPALQPIPDGAPDYSQPLCLLAKTLAFRCPVTGVDLRFDSRLGLTV